MSLIKKIQNYYKNKCKIPTLFTTPSHNQGQYIIPILKKLLGKKYFNVDFSEIEGFDNLREPIDTLKYTQEKISKIYNSKKSFMLTNGSSSGIIATMKALLKKDDEVIIARNCHISVYNGLVISGARPIWVYPNYNEEWQICTEITPEIIINAIEEHPNAKALILTSPTYEGIHSDIEAISMICKKNNIVLIVDEAHGALLNFANLGNKPAIELGADISIQSLHKTAGAPNPCALLHISKESKITQEMIQESLNLFNTTSPSYPLLVAIEGTVDYLNSNGGKIKISKLLNAIDDFKKKLPSNINIYEKNNDKTKLLLKFKGKNNLDIASILNEKYRIEEEFSTEYSMLFLTGIGSSSPKLKKLAKTLNEISDISTKQMISNTPQPVEKAITLLTPAEAYNKEFCLLNKEDAIGKVSAETIINYPPGIPTILPGELITQKNICYINRKNIRILK